MIYVNSAVFRNDVGFAVGGADQIYGGIEAQTTGEIHRAANPGAASFVVSQRRKKVGGEPTESFHDTAEIYWQVAVNSFPTELAVSYPTIRPFDAIPVATVLPKSAAGSSTSL
jgi:hypothetical protein